MSDPIHLPYEADIDAVIIERYKAEKEKFPDIELVDKIILKNGPIAYKVALHWVFVNRHTGEVNHHTLRLETYRRMKNGWVSDLEHSLTLEEHDEPEVTRLLNFLKVVLDKTFEYSSGSYLVLPVDKSQTEFKLSEENINTILHLSQQSDPYILSRLIDLLGNTGSAPFIHEKTLVQFLDLSEKAGINILERLIHWITQSQNIDQIVDKLETLNLIDIQKLNTAIGLSNLKSVLDIWISNKNNDNEEFWQKILSEYSFVFGQIFAFPVVIIKDKAYVGGKSIANAGGNIVDFLCSNLLTKNTALVEIKTPKTELMGTQYRGDVFNISKELSGSIIQVSNYKNSLLKYYHSLRDASDTDFDAFDPKCVVIIGSIGSELNERKQYKSFELFRSGLKDVQVITYDELFGKIELLVRVLEGDNIV